MWHWHRVGKVARRSVMGAIIGPPAVAAAAAVTVVGAITVAPVFIYHKVAESVFQSTSVVQLSLTRTICDRLIGHPLRLRRQNAIIRRVREHKFRSTE